jgi:hypothetical protein
MVLIYFLLPRNPKTVQKIMKNWKISHTITQKSKNGTAKSKKNMISWKTYHTIAQKYKNGTAKT